MKSNAVVPVEKLLRKAGFEPAAVGGKKSSQSMFRKWVIVQVGANVRVMRLRTYVKILANGKNGLGLVRREIGDG